MILYLTLVELFQLAINHPQLMSFRVQVYPLLRSHQDQAQN